MIFLYMRHYSECLILFRSESVEGFLSPSRCGSRNGEKDWESASTTSSVASGTEYTGECPPVLGKQLDGG